MASQVRALVCCTVNHSNLTNVRGVTEDHDREYNDGSDTDDWERDCVSASDHEWFSEQSDDDRKSEGTRNVTWGMDDTPEDFVSGVEEGIK
jgi:hypothetical protein